MGPSERGRGVLSRRWLVGTGGEESGWGSCSRGSSGRQEASVVKVVKKAAVAVPSQTNRSDGSGEIDSERGQGLARHNTRHFLPSISSS